jgi:hypothetical protein
MEAEQIAEVGGIVGAAGVGVDLLQADDVGFEITQRGLDAAEPTLGIGPEVPPEVPCCYPPGAR